jgi:hypothetical protein
VSTHYNPENLDEGPIYDRVRMLAASTIRGRYALDDPQGPDVTSGQPLSIWLSGQWIAGRVEGGSYVDDGSCGPHEGYAFYADDGSTCGLCIGMKVRLG